MIERRAVPRRRVFKGGCVLFAGAQLDCIVRNLSPHGARIDFDARVELPPSFRLTIISNSLIRTCRPVWCNERRNGIVFIDLAGAPERGLPATAQ
jgi:hypothetical protein